MTPKASAKTKRNVAKSKISNALKDKRGSKLAERRHGLQAARRISLALALCLILTTTYYLNSPTPSGLRNPWKYRCFVGGKRVAMDMAHIMSFLTSSPYVINFRFLIDLLAPPAPLEVPGSNIRASITSFGAVKVRLYQPIRRSEGLGPAIVYVHGGAFAVGSAAVFDEVTRKIAEELNCTLVSVDYRLSPENPFPAAFHDTLNASTWFMDHAEDFGVDRSRIGIVGDSAGGTLAGSVAQELHDDPRYPDFAFHALINALTQVFDIHTPSALLSRFHFGYDGSIVTWWEAAMFCTLYIVGHADERLQNAFIQNTHVSSEFLRSGAPQLQYVNHTLIPLRLRNYSFITAPDDRARYADQSSAATDELWDEIKDKVLDPRMSPLMRANMTGLPPAFIATCEFDPVRDHGIFYAMRLKQAGVPVRWENYDGGFHGVLGPSWPFVFEDGKQMFQDFVSFAREHLAAEPKKTEPRTLEERDIKIDGSS